MRHSATEWDGEVSVVPMHHQIVRFSLATSYVVFDADLVPNRVNHVSSGTCSCGIAGLRENVPQNHAAAV